MKIKDRLTALESKTVPQRWAAWLRQVDKADTIQMELLLEMAAVGAVLPIAPEIEQEFTRLVDEWRNGAPEDNGLSEAQNAILVAGLSWLVFSSIPAEYYLPGGAAIISDVVADYFDNAVSVFDVLPEADAENVASAVAHRLHVRCNEVKESEIPTADAAKILDGCLDLVRDAVKAVLPAAA